jgi:TonB-dependent SusC/RagA subfamily outer membrane receptor
VNIESMEVLKDASAAAIYGARAANGVVLITTRRAKAGKSAISVDAYTGVQSVAAKKYDVMTAKDWVTIRNAAGQPWMDSSTVQQTDWQDELFRQAKVNSKQLSLLNGNENINSAIIGSYFNQEGIVKGSGYERFTVRVNTTSKLKPWLSVGENIWI